jgi:hypothetical protein
MIMLYSDYSENGVITSCIPTIKRTEKKLVSAVHVDCIRLAATQTEKRLWEQEKGNWTYLWDSRLGVSWYIPSVY